MTAKMVNACPYCMDMDRGTDTTGYGYADSANLEEVGYAWLRYIDIYTYVYMCICKWHIDISIMKQRYGYEIRRFDTIWIHEHSKP